jgi:hypothetical protein
MTKLRLNHLRKFLKISGGSGSFSVGLEIIKTAWSRLRANMMSEIH